MAAYVESIRRAPRTLTEREQKALLRVTGEHRAGWRDHVLFAMALGTGLRTHELVALDVGDVFDDVGRVRRRLSLRVFKGDGRGDDDRQEVLLPDGLRAKLDKLRALKASEGESFDRAAPLFVSQRGTRLSTRQLRHAFAVWQEKIRLRARVDRWCWEVWTARGGVAPDSRTRTSLFTPRQRSRVCALGKRKFARE